MGSLRKCTPVRLRLLKLQNLLVSIGNHRSRTFADETGVPQGSGTAVTLFLVKINGVFAQLTKGIRIFVYGDDILKHGGWKYHPHDP